MSGEIHSIQSIKIYPDHDDRARMEVTLGSGAQHLAWLPTEATLKALTNLIIDDRKIGAKINEHQHVTPSG